MLRAGMSNEMCFSSPLTHHVDVRDAFGDLVNLKSFQKPVASGCGYSQSARNLEGRVFLPHEMTFDGRAVRSSWKKAVKFGVSVRRKLVNTEARSGLR